MEVDSVLPALLRGVAMGDRSTIAKSWDSIPSEGGAPLPQDPRAGGPSDRIRTADSVSDAVLVRLVLDALHGVQCSVIKVRELSSTFCSCPADRTCFHVPSLWCRSSSTYSFGQLLESIGHSGLEVFFLHKFVEYYLFSGRHNTGLCNAEETGCSYNFKDHPPYSLVNQAFAVAVKNLLEGYNSALSTLTGSVRLRRNTDTCKASSVNGDLGQINIITSESTILEIYLHTEELRRFIQSLGNICFPKFGGPALFQEGLTTSTKIEFQNFPRGADLLSYLYVRFHDADPLHYGLLKYLFIHACEPYCFFIKSWIYHATVNDPYNEFLLPASVHQNDISDMSKAEEQLSVPCFLKEVYRPLYRAGQQLQILLKLLSLFNLSSIIDGGASVLRIPTNEEIFTSFGNSGASMLSSPSFSKDSVDALVHRRQVMYNSLTEKLEHAFTKFEVKPFLNQNDYPSTPFSRSHLKVNRSIPISSLSSGNLMSSLKSAGQASIRSVGLEDADDSLNESLHDKDSTVFSDLSSSCSTEEEYENESDGLSCNNMFPSTLTEDYISISGFKKLSSNECFVSNPLSYCSDHKLINSLEPTNLHNKDETFMQKSLCCQFLNTTGGVASAPDCKKYQNGSSHLAESFVKIIPFGGIGCVTDSSGHTLPTAGGNDEIFETQKFLFDEVFSSSSNLGSLYPVNGQNECQGLSTKHSWDIGNLYNLSHNPMVSKVAGIGFGSRGEMRKHRFSIPCFDFKTVSSSLMVYSPSTSYVPYKGSHGIVSLSSAPCVHVNKQSGELSDKVHHISSTEQPRDVPCLYSNVASNTEKISHHSAGGAFWTKMLHYTSEIGRLSDEDKDDSPDAATEMPLDVVINNCIVQEILLQYEFVTYFTIRLLEDGFGLQEHLLALRRYHFMEQGDWADAFILSLCDKEWPNFNSELRAAEFQGLLDSALQRSSCYADPLSELLFICPKEKKGVSVPASSYLDMFDDMFLGYRLNWPINIVVTWDSLQLYADIFGYLVKVRLAGFSLTKLWTFLKDLTHSTHQCKYIKPDMLKSLNTLIHLRQQVHHFVSTLQQCIHSQLSDVPWCQFQHARNQVKDVQDLESLHMHCLNDAIRICFLSAEAQPVTVIIKNVLHCGMDLWSCFSGVDFKTNTDVNQLNLQSAVNASQVAAIQSEFERNLKELYILHLKAPKHGQLHRFWDLLNCNNYYSSKITKDGGSFYL